MSATGGAGTRGLVLGLIGVAVFGFTLPATRLALTGLDPVFVGLGRSVAAGILAALILVVTRTPLPPRRIWGRLAIVSSGVVVGFPLFATLAMQYVPASHGGVVLAILPLATALAAVLFGGERPSPRFWVFCLLGAAVVLAFALIKGGGSGGFGAGDLLLLAAIVTVSAGYAQGGALARQMQGWQVICWALVIGLPFVATFVVVAAGPIDRGATATAWGGFIYVAAFSQLLGFFAWYRGLALGGIARVGQLQLLQPFVTLAASALILAERITWIDLGFAIAVVTIVASGRRWQKPEYRDQGSDMSRVTLPSSDP